MPVAERAAPGPSAWTTIKPAAAVDPTPGNLATQPDTTTRTVPAAEQSALARVTQAVTERPGGRMAGQRPEMARSSTLVMGAEAQPQVSPRVTTYC